MNYHSDSWINEKVHDHYREAREYFPDDSIVGIFLQGSQNYGLDYEGSDVDTKLIVVPTFKDIAMNKQPISTTHIRSNSEHIDWKDVRLYIQNILISGTDLLMKEKPLLVMHLTRPLRQ